MSGRQTQGYVDSSLDGDVMRVRWTHERDTIVAFTVQYEALIEGQYYPVVRYDTAHGRPHRDTLAWNG